MRAQATSRFLYMVLALALAGRVGSPGLAGQAPALPELPRLAFDHMLPDARAVVEKAYGAAVAHPRDPTASGKLGMVLQAHNFFAEAEVCYRRVCLLDPRSFQWKYYLGLVEAKRGSFGLAVSAFGEAVRLSPEYLPAQLNLGESLLASGRWEEANKLYEGIVAKRPGSAEAYYGLGRARAVRKDLKGAVESFRKACELFPNFGPAHFGLAHAYRRLGKEELSLAELALYDTNKTSTPDVRDQFLEEIAALNVKPPDPLRLGIELEREGKLEEAAATFEKALEMNRQLAQAHVELISLYGQLGQPIRAEEHFQAAVRLDPHNPKSYFNHGLVLSSQGKFVEAEQAFRNALEIDPQFPGADLNLGNMLEAQGHLPEAAAEYQKALEISPNDSRAHFVLGRLLVNQEKYQEGIRHLLKSVGGGDEENKPTYLYALGAAYARSGDPTNGLRYLRLAREGAAARGQSKLVSNIDEDLEALKTQRNSP
jgi:tetratricopeptide (TPR) repeat protein